MALSNGSFLAGKKYRIVRFISSGGFGCTYEGEHTLMQARVAIKEFFAQDFCNRDEQTGRVSIGTLSKTEFVSKLKERFIREAKVLFTLQHPNIVHVTDVFEENGTAYYVMDYVDGRSLGDILREKSRLPEAEALSYISQVCEALDYVHSMGHLHLDIKPDNIMVDRNGKVVIIDFGTSKQFADNGGVTATTFGLTPGFAPPEQCSGDASQYSAATDIYSVGATLYRMLSGETPVDALKRASGAKLPQLAADVSPSVSHAVFKAMSLMRDARPQSAAEFMNLISTFKVENPAPAGDDNATRVNFRNHGYAPENDFNHAPAQRKRGIGKTALIAAAAVLIAIPSSIFLYKTFAAETPASTDSTQVMAKDGTSATEATEAASATQEEAAATAEEPRNELRVASAWCSYQLNNQAGNNYHPRNMIDGNSATAWAAKLSQIQDYSGNGIIQGPVFELASPGKITGVELQNGYCKNSTSFKNNTRASKVTIYRYHLEFDGEYGEDQEAGFINKEDIIYEGPIRDSMEMQYFPVSASFDNSQPTRAVGLLFHDGNFHRGAKWNDLCLSEIKIYGR